MGRPWWQWALGLGLIAAAVIHYFVTTPPGMRLVRLELPPKQIRMSSDLAEAEVLPAEAGSLAGCSVLLVTLDTTRADRLGCYGNEEIQTPNLDRLAAEGVIFSQALASSPTTLPSHASILTGLYPYHHGARVNGVFRLDESADTLAEVLSAEGYATAAMVSAFVLDRRYGLAQGFDTYDDDMSGEPEPDPFRYEERMAPRTTARAVEWLRAAADGPFFLWVHYFDPHAAYLPPSPYAEQYKDNLYDGEIALVDHELGRLLDVVEELGLTGRTLVVVVGDHGESVGWRWEAAHGHLVYDTTVQVPLLMRCGDRLGGGVHLTRRVTQVDLMPTILSLLGVTGPEGMDGVDLTAATDVERAVFVENVQALMEYGWAPQAAVYDGKYKYIYGPNPELYDLSADPLETEDLHASQPQVAAALRAKLADLFGSDLDTALSPTPTYTPTEVELAKLQGLGYVITSSGELPPAGRRPDPKEMLPILDKVERVVFGYLPHGEVEVACKELEELAQAHPDFLAVFRYLGFLYRNNGQLAQAEEAFRQALRIYPGATETIYALAIVLGMQGDDEGAIELLEQIIAKHPQHFSARYRLGLVLLQSGRPQEAAEHLEAAFELNPADKNCLASMVRAFVVTDRGEQAKAALRRKLEEDPRLSFVRGALAEALKREERHAEALLRDGVELMPNDPEAVGNLALFLAQCPDEKHRAPYEATALMEQLCQDSGYQDPEALYRLSAVYTVIGRYDEGLAVAERGRALATEAGEAELVASFNALMASQTQAKEKGLAHQPAGGS